MLQTLDILNALDAHFPFSRAESWDKTGLLIGDHEACASRVFVLYEVTQATLEAARQARADVLVAYHPLIFRPLENLDFRNHTAKLAAQIIAANQTLICVHTALDGAPQPNALGDALAAQLGLFNVRVHKPSGAPKLVKIVTFVPPEAFAKVSNALWDAGAGHIGRYDQASFRSQGIGTFRPLEGANPYLGTLGEREETAEWRLEVVAPAEKWRELVAVLRQAHPYEEVAFDVFDLKNADESGAFGPLRLGEVEPISFADFARNVQEKLAAPGLRVVRPPGFEIVRKVACSPGSGASFIDSLPAGTCFVTGDIKHHDALKALAKNIAILDVSHAATETTAVALMAGALKSLVGVEVIECVLDTNPFSTV